MSPKAAARLLATERELTAEIAALSARAAALPDWDRGGYERLTQRANELERICVKLAAKRQAVAA
jgi:hypothetical protein